MSFWILPVKTNFYKRECFIFVSGSRVAFLDTRFSTATIRALSCAILANPTATTSDYRCPLCSAHRKILNSMLFRYSVSRIVT